MIVVMARAGDDGVDRGPPLGDRAGSGSKVVAAMPCPARHCWVTLPPDATEARPGLLLQWRKVELGRFEGLVVYPAQLRPGRWATVTEWIPADLLTAADP